MWQTPGNQGQVPTIKDNEKEARIGDLMSEGGNLFKKAEVPETKTLEALDKARKEIYGDLEAGRFS